MGVSKSKTESQLYCLKWKILPRMFLNKTTFLQTSFPHPILAVESCSCNIVLKLVMLIRKFQRKHASLPTPMSLYHSWPALPGLQRTDCWYTHYSHCHWESSSLFYLGVFWNSFPFLINSWHLPSQDYAFFSSYCSCSSITDTLLIFTASVSSPSSMNF